MGPESDLFFQLLFRILVKLLFLVRNLFSIIFSALNALITFIPDKISSSIPIRAPILFCPFNVVCFKVFPTLPIIKAETGNIITIISVSLGLNMINT